MNDVSNVVLEATGVQYQMSFDEAAFFEWLNKIPSVDSYQGQRFTLYIKVIVDTLDEDALNELAALYRRYRIDPRELRVLNTGRLGHWFSSPDRWWHNEVFGTDSTAKDGPHLGEKHALSDNADHEWAVGDAGTHANMWPPVEVAEFMTEGDAVLKATGVRYYSEFDEAAFFEWLDKNPQVDSYRGRGDTLYISVNVNIGDESELSEFPALYERYNIDMTELRVLNSGNFGPWFSDPKWWWHKAVFG
ncbi:Uncharacterised protein [Mycobacteroides abscessus subsp. bolletii]|uniref:hypothetical protein n=1 Tax=Mycobacteroides abscessus TaxID=36809 RepID=UPI00092BA496|nr:hypothetical protein [Mycobacteroides abscessus]SHP33132.1 Uncharacterised protein [Mycobacteroides abscessus subsp. bolletii]SHR26757.1 Uncharacterised protein [Mycobacteroides abscessus subsp. bolletii]SHR73757.1 Uncharacterised protein [Mycobacteroides abscessus subsp. bolletii]SHS01372.1 Uncharacterised protein [Mycobacteroides abscessus subsp. bolletii]SHX51126.1 Uncharacterised protein [Mycobacteroides abscessus subsp. bolletii]